MIKSVASVYNVNFKGNFRIGKDKQHETVMLLNGIRNCPDYAKDVLLLNVESLADTLNKNSADNVTGYIDLNYKNGNSDEEDFYDDICLSVYEDGKADEDNLVASGRASIGDDDGLYNPETGLKYIKSMFKNITSEAILKLSDDGTEHINIKA